VSGPMQGVRVVEIAVMVAGPSAGGILADWGADVVKIEPPTGDPLRAIQKVLGPDADSNPFFDPDNRGKRSVVLDFRQPDQLQTALALIDNADVLVTNIRPAALARLGMDSESLLARNPRLIYALVTGYGLTGPDAAAGAYDMGAYWARGGVAGLLSQPGQDLPIQRAGMGDHFTGMTVAGMVGTALFERERTGRGQLVTTSLLRIAAYQVSSDFNMKLMLDREPTRNVRHTEANPIWNNYTAGDGKQFWLIGVEAVRHWPALVRIIERPDLEHDVRYATQPDRAVNSVSLIAELDGIFATRPRDDWAKRFDAEKDFFWAPVNSVDDVLADPQTQASGAITEVADGSFPKPMIASPVDFHGVPPTVRTRAPRLGEHTDEVLAELHASPQLAGEP
jgi:crotonobetainyl-CoA:carnitine CoA-transferase CaiB-like acyl-CoA transferase